MSNVVRLTPRSDTNASERPGSPAPVGRAVYTVKEVAQMLSLSLGGTYALVRTGEIPAIKLGGRWAIPKRRFHAWLDNTEGAKPDTDAARVANVG